MTFKGFVFKKQQEFLAFSIIKAYAISIDYNGFFLEEQQELWLWNYADFLKINIEFLYKKTSFKIFISILTFILIFPF